MLVWHWHAPQLGFSFKLRKEAVGRGRCSSQKGSGAEAALPFSSSWILIVLTIEQELHDARRVGTAGGDARTQSALNMVINWVTELAYKSKAELEVQLNVAKANLHLVIANNEMLEEALKSEPSPSTRIPGPGGANESPTEDSSNNNSRFFKTFFNNNGTRPGTQLQTHFTSPSIPSLHAHAHENDALQALRARHDKIALEAELKSLSQALFEEANKMVASERAEAERELEKPRPLAEELKKMKTELREDREELREAREDREELREARVGKEGENAELRSPVRSPESRHVAYISIWRALPALGYGAFTAISSVFVVSPPILIHIRVKGRERLRAAEAESEESGRTPRRGALGLAAYSAAQWDERVRASSPGLSPPLTAVAAAPDDLWEGA
ncbi:hypothetical protein GGX14DRAFT_579541 [Mycena pura]|uniref:GDP/GTP exchange factor Sec2 N-terminal domain-containing protein n=1 Tax=Mycena pura TaxID=153505 RepID=A0AAD6UMG1_9AGAR|nr:hypothetical protein GGX14DRAFT_579541 [Mycena pura]